MRPDASSVGSVNLWFTQNRLNEPVSQRVAGNDSFRGPAKNCCGSWLSGAGSDTVPARKAQFPGEGAVSFGEG